MDLNCQFRFTGKDEATGKNTAVCVHCGRRIVTPLLRISAECRSEKPRIDCLHRHEATGARECESCAGRVKIKTFRCDLHGECTLAKQLDGLACCAACKDFTAQ